MPTERQLRDRAMIERLRANGGRDDSGGNTLVIVTTKSLATKRPLTVPVCVREDGADLVIAASAGGQPSNPGWYACIEADDDVEVEYLGETFRASAVLVPNSADRDRLFAMMSEVISGLYQYQDRCRNTRQIPIVRLVRR